jgi:O-antigen/teichoic acid export membrane protein
LTAPVLKKEPSASAHWLRHFLSYGMSVVAMNALSFFIIPIYTHKISPSDYGVFEILSRGSDIFGMIIMSGLGIAALSFYQLESENPEKRNRVFSTAVLGVALNGLLLLISCVPSVSGIAHLLFRSTDQAWAVRMMLAVIPLEVLFQLGLIDLQSRFESRTYTVFAFARLAIGILASIFFVAVLNWGLYGALLSLLIHTGTMAALTTFNILQRSNWKFDLGLLGKLLAFGLPFVIGGPFRFVMDSGDRYFLQAAHGSQMVGIYSVGYKLGSLVYLAVLTPFAKYWGAVMIGVANSENGPRTIARIATYLSIVYLFSSLLLSLVSPALLRILVGRAYWSAHTVVPVVLLAYWFWTISIIADTGFYVSKQTKWKPFLFAGSCAVCLISYAVLIPRFGNAGAAWATVLGYGVFGMSTIYFANRFLPVPFEYGRICKVLSLVAVLFLLGRAAVSFLGVHELLVTLAAGVLFPALLHVIGFWSPDEKQGVKEFWLTNPTMSALRSSQVWLALRDSKKM